MKTENLVLEIGSNAGKTVFNIHRGTCANPNPEAKRTGCGAYDDSEHKPAFGILDIIIFIYQYLLIFVY